eukprot:COSAG03_NODE_27673_length_252_cov_0.424837_1_plen_42_part_01
MCVYGWVCGDVVRFCVVLGGLRIFENISLCVFVSLCLCVSLS